MLTNYPNGITSFGAPIFANGIPVTNGNYFFVDPDNGSDSYDGKSPEQAFKTIAAAYAAVTSNHNDVICLSAYSSHVLSSMLTVSKNRVHFVGMDGSHRYYGQGAKVSMGVTTAVTDLFGIKNLGVRNTFTNIKFMSDNTLTQHIGTVGEGGEYACYTNCEFYSSVKLDSDTHAELVLNGDSTQFFGCTFGSLADAIVGDKVRPAVLLTAGTVAAGKVSRDVLFDGCRFWKQAGGTTTAFVKAANATDVERVMEFHNCQFIANPLGSAPAVAISTPTLTAGIIILTGDTCATKCTKIATATGIFNCTPARVATATIGIQTS